MILCSLSRAELVIANYFLASRAIGDASLAGSSAVATFLSLVSLACSEEDVEWERFCRSQRSG